MICKHILLTFLNEPELIKWFEVLLSSTDNSINY